MEPTNPPIVITNLATSVTQTSAVLKGLVLTGASVFTSGWFEWGETISLGRQTSQKGLGSLPSMSFSDALTILSPNTNYYYRAVAQNQNGIGRGNILSFRASAFFIPPITPPVTPTGFKSLSIKKEVSNPTFPKKRF